MKKRRIAYLIGGFGILLIIFAIFFTNTNIGGNKNIFKKIYGENINNSKIPLYNNQKFEEYIVNRTQSIQNNYIIPFFKNLNVSRVDENVVNYIADSLRIVVQTSSEDNIEEYFKQIYEDYHISNHEIGVYQYHLSNISDSYVILVKDQNTNSDYSEELQIIIKDNSNHYVIAHYYLDQYRFSDDYVLKMIDLIKKEKEKKEQKLCKDGNCIFDLGKQSISFHLDNQYEELDNNNINKYIISLKDEEDRKIFVKLYYKENSTSLLDEKDMDLEIKPGIIKEDIQIDGKSIKKYGLAESETEDNEASSSKTYSKEYLYQIKEDMVVDITIKSNKNIDDSIIKDFITYEVK